MAEEERLTVPWTFEERGESFVIKDANGQHLAYLYFEDEPGRRRQTHRISSDMARRLASQICKLPDYITKAKGEAL